MDLINCGAIHKLLTSLDRRRLYVKLHPLMFPNRMQHFYATPISVKQENFPDGICSLCGSVGNVVKQVLENDLKKLFLPEKRKIELDMSSCSNCSLSFNRLRELSSVYRAAKTDFEDYLIGMLAIMRLTAEIGMKLGNLNPGSINIKLESKPIDETTEEIAIDVHEVKQELDENLVAVDDSQDPAILCEDIRRLCDNSSSISTLSMTQPLLNCNLKRIPCETCGRTFQSKTTLFIHKRRKTCETVIKRQLRKKVKNICYFCGVKTKGMSALASHLKMHTLEFPTYECGKCSKIYRDEYTFVQHNLLCGTSHEQIQNLPNDIVLKIARMTKRTKKDTLTVQYKCPDCPETYISKKSLKIHMQTNCKKNVEKLFEVRKRYRERYNSMKNRQGKTDFKCSSCNKYFASANFLLNHSKFDCHKRGKTCTLCGIEFDTKNEKKAHWLEEHYREQVKCYFCQKILNGKSYLASHMNFHTREKPYKCSCCAKNFRSFKDLDYHSVMVEGKTMRSGSGSWQKS